jgi:hypothetical protein
MKAATTVTANGGCIPANSLTRTMAMGNMQTAYATCSYVNEYYFN